MKRLLILLLVVVFLSGCVRQDLSAKFCVIAENTELYGPGTLVEYEAGVCVIEEFNYTEAYFVECNGWRDDLSLILKLRVLPNETEQNLKDLQNFRKDNKVCEVASLK